MTNYLKDQRVGFSAIERCGSWLKPSRLIIIYLARKRNYGGRKNRTKRRVSLSVLGYCWKMADSVEEDQQLRSNPLLGHKCDKQLQSFAL